MTARDPNEAKNAYSRQASQRERISNQRRDPDEATLLYKYFKSQRKEHKEKKEEHQEKLDRLWDQKQEVLENGRDSDQEVVSTELRRIDALREREKECEARREKEFVRSEHALERLEDIRRENQDEGRKLMYDLFKHLTTLGTGSILILGALSNNLLEDARPQWLIPFIFLLLFASVGGALVYMYSVGNIFLASGRLESSQDEESQDEEGGLDHWLQAHLGYVFLITSTLFGAGIFLFMLFAVINL